MTNQGQSSADPADEEGGALFRAAYQKADIADAATSSGERRRAWLRFIPSWLLAMAEEYLRDAAIFAALLASVIAGIHAFDTDHLGFRVGLLIMAVLGPILVLTVAFKRWPIGRQWLVILAVIAVQVGLMVANHHVTA